MWGGQHETHKMIRFLVIKSVSHATHVRYTHEHPLSTLHSSCLPASIDREFVSGMTQRTPRAPHRRRVEVSACDTYIFWSIRSLYNPRHATMQYVRTRPTHFTPSVPRRAQSQCARAARAKAARSLQAARSVPRAPPARPAAQPAPRQPASSAAPPRREQHSHRLPRSTPPLSAERARNPSPAVQPRELQHALGRARATTDACLDGPCPEHGGCSARKS